MEHQYIWWLAVTSTLYLCFTADLTEGKLKIFAYFNLYTLILFLTDDVLKAKMASVFEALLLLT